MSTFSGTFGAGLVSAQLTYRSRRVRHGPGSGRASGSRSRRQSSAACAPIVASSPVAARPAQPEARGLPAAVPTASLRGRSPISARRRRGGPRCRPPRSRRPSSDGSCRRSRSGRPRTRRPAHSSQSGFERSSGGERQRPTRSWNWASVPGSGSVTWRTCWGDVELGEVDPERAAEPASAGTRPAGGAAAEDGGG